MSDALEVRTLLVELFVEELPPKSLKKLGAAFASGIAESLRAQGLATADATVVPWATPRRLAVSIDGVSSQAADRAVSVKLMPAGVGLAADGSATPALLKKLASVGADASAVPQLQRRADGKTEALFLDTVAPGATLAAGLQRALEAAIAALPIAKAMQYQLADGWTSVSFVRPAHGLVALHGAEVVPVRVLGLDAGRVTHGHRFEGSRAPIELSEASRYAAQLADEGAVVASFDTRRDRIVQQLAAAASAAGAGLRVVDDDALLDEVTALVERPNVVACAFDPAFLAVPPECLVLTMKANQKYFPLVDANGALTERFLVVANVSPADPRAVVEGNERVVRPRLADAKFFFDQDRKRTLASRVPELDRVVYHAKLGSQGDRVRRLRRIARWVAGRIGADASAADRAAELAKADLSTDMVGEFPELQGVMGGYYAQHDGEPADVAAAIREQYVHRRATADEGAANPVAQALLIADRAETLVGIWGIGSKPTGEKDPFGLRRSALTLIRGFESLDRTLDLRELLAFVASTFEPGTVAPAALDEVETFVYDRCANQLAATHDPRAVDAVLSQRPPLGDVARRLHAVREFQRLDEAVALAAANKRVGNILRKADAAVPDAVDAALLVEPAEAALHGALGRVAPDAEARFAEGAYVESLRALAALREPVDAFFESVMVNADDPALRANRLALLARLHAAMNRVADLSKLAA